MNRTRSCLENSRFEVDPTSSHLCFSCFFHSLKCRSNKVAKLFPRCTIENARKILRKPSTKQSCPFQFPGKVWIPFKTISPQDCIYYLEVSFYFCPLFNVLRVVYLNHWCGNSRPQNCHPQRRINRRGKGCRDFINSTRENYSLTEFHSIFDFPGNFAANTRQKHSYFAFPVSKIHVKFEKMAAFFSHLRSCFFHSFL